MRCDSYGNVIQDMDETVADTVIRVEQLVKTHSLELAFFKDLFHDRMVTMDAIAIELEKLRERLV